MAKEENKNSIVLEIEDSNYKTLPTKKYSERKPWVKADPGEIKNFIPGTLIKLQVKEGDTVKEGDNLVIFEAMKMHNQLKAPFAGKVKNIAAKEGDKMPKGFVIMRVEPS